MINYKQIRRITVKIGTSTLFGNEENSERISQFAEVISNLKGKGKEIVLVTSGAVRLGVEKLGLTEKPTEYPLKQACSAVGQSALMAIYADKFAEHNRTVGQILLTRNVLFKDERSEKVKNTFRELFEHDVIPIVNANDTVTVSQLGFDENDTLSAVTAKISCSELLVILTDVDGLFDKNPEQPDARLIRQVTTLTSEMEYAAKGKGSEFSSGGMATKLKAVKFAAEGGIPTVILNGSNPEILYELFEGEFVGTEFKISINKGE